eukprot:gene2911-3496_t
MASHFEFAALPPVGHGGGSSRSPPPDLAGGYVTGFWGGRSTCHRHRDAPESPACDQLPPVPAAPQPRLTPSLRPEAAGIRRALFLCRKNTCLAIHDLTVMYKISNDEMAMWQGAFRMFDLNNDGYITAPELHRTCQDQLGHGAAIPTAQHLLQLIKGSDVNNDHKIDLAEFLR